MMQSNSLIKETERRQAEERAKRVYSSKRERQRDLAANTMGKKVHDIVQFPDDNGDDVVIWIYGDVKKRDFDENDKAIVMISISEPGTQRLILDEVTVKKNRYWLPDGNLLVVALQAGTYSY